MKQYNVLIEVPDDLDVTMRDESGNFAIGNDVAYEIYLLGAYWPALVTPGTVIANPKKLMHCVIHTDIQDVLTLLDSMIIAYSLDWTVVGIQSYKNEVPATYDEEGNILSPETPLVLLPVDMDIAGDYFADRYSEYGEDGSPIGLPEEKTVDYIHRYQGMAPWM